MDVGGNGILKNHTSVVASGVLGFYNDDPDTANTSTYQMAYHKLTLVINSSDNLVQSMRSHQTQEYSKLTS